MEKNKETKEVPASDSEQLLFIKSFEMALPIMEKVLLHIYGSKFRRFRDRFKAQGCWDGENVAKHFVLCVGKLSVLPRSEREYICAIGHKAKEIYDNKLTKEK